MAFEIGIENDKPAFPAIPWKCTATTSPFALKIGLPLDPLTENPSNWMRSWATLLKIPALIEVLMTDDDWFDESLHTFGMFVSGRPLRAPGPRGERLEDDSFLLWFNAHPEPGKATLPLNEWVHAGEVVISTDSTHPAGETVQAGQVIDIEPRSLIVLRQV